MGTGRQAGTEEEGAARLAAAAVEWTEPWTCVRWPLAESGREHARANGGNVEATRPRGWWQE